MRMRRVTPARLCVIVRRKAIPLATKVSVKLIATAVLPSMANDTFIKHVNIDLIGTLNDTVIITIIGSFIKELLPI